MINKDDSNQHFNLAVDFVNNTNQNLFLTGKAGTGKTTFLKYIRENCHKKMAVTAPTGVAAINAGGTTIHSLFQLPFGSYVPEEGFYEGNFYSRSTLLRQLKLSKAKRNLLNELELLIIDEVSMVKADLLDALDQVLRHIRKKRDIPFGGVQMLFIGDLYQLPPVVREDEWSILKRYYNGSFFFNSHALKENLPVYIELKKIYRQESRDFIRILNNIRNNQVTSSDLDLLNSHYDSDFQPEKKGEYITLTSHNGKAEIINNRELTKLKAPLKTFKAEVSGDFNENSYPADETLQLKEGAQIMFLKNDTGEDKRFYNGKLGTVKKIKHRQITVSFPDSDEEMQLEKETWKNIRYSLNKESGEVEEVVKGTFTQYPVRLAWAITIHKSQGLTFDKAIIDAGDSFAAGQVYVALSRLTSLNGLVLYSRIAPEAISSDSEAISFSQNEKEESRLLEELKEAQKKYILQKLIKIFDLDNFRSAFINFQENLNERNIPEKGKAITLAEEMKNKAKSLSDVGRKFSKFLEKIIVQADDYEKLDERTRSAVKYYSEELRLHFSVPLEEHFREMKPKSGVKSYLSNVTELIGLVKQKDLELGEAALTSEGLKNKTDITELFSRISAYKSKHLNELKQEIEEVKPQRKQKKGESQRMTLQMFREGKSIEEIAGIRSLVRGTIEGHLAGFIKTGEVKVSELVDKEKIEKISEAARKTEGNSSSDIKKMLDNDVSYGEIRAVLNYLNSESGKAAAT